MDSYKELWDMPDEITKLLKHFTGEKKPYIKNPKDERRMFFQEFEPEARVLLLNFFRDNKVMVLTDIIKGRGRMTNAGRDKNEEELFNFISGNTGGISNEKR